jgi:hypothetical protein
MSFPDRPAQVFEIVPGQAEARLNAQALLPLPAGFLFLTEALASDSDEMVKEGIRDATSFLRLLLELAEKTAM